MTTPHVDAGSGGGKLADAATGGGDAGGAKPDASAVSNDGSPSSTPDSGAAQDAGTDTGSSPPPTLDLHTPSRIGSGQTFDLTTAGPLDWAHWSVAGVLLTDHPAGSGRIGTLGGSNIVGYAQYQQTFMWTDATPAPSNGQSSAGVNQAVGSTMFTLPVAATPSRATLTLYLATWNADAQVSVTMNGASAPAPQPVPGDNSDTKYYTVQVVFSSPTSEKMTFGYEMTQDKGGGTISMLAATLAP